MKNYIEALLAREKSRLDETAKKQKATTGQMEILRKLNQELVMEVSERAGKIKFLNEMLREENENA